MSIPAIPAIPAITPAVGAIGASSTTTAAGVQASGASSSFGDILGNAIDQLQGITDNAQNLALAGATGSANIADVSVAATQAELAVDLVTETRDKAVDAFNSIMSMTT